MSRDFPGCPVVNTSPSGAKGAGSNPGQGAKIPHASQPKNQNKKQKQYCNKFSTDFLTNGPCQKKSFKKRGKLDTNIEEGHNLQTQNSSQKWPFGRLILAEVSRAGPPLGTWGW